MIQKFDIPINLKVLAQDEAEAEKIAINWLKEADKTLNYADIVDYELFEFVSSDLSQSCCC